MRHAKQFRKLVLAATETTAQPAAEYPCKPTAVFLYEHVDGFEVQREIFPFDFDNRNDFSEDNNFMQRILNPRFHRNLTSTALQTCT